jgi:FMN phosphatase YigB (HAD superfamily)
VFKAVLAELNAEVSDCIMIADSLESDIKGANNMKMDCIHFQPEGVKTFKATHNISDLTEIKEIL